MYTGFGFSRGKNELFLNTMGIANAEQYGSLIYGEKFGLDDPLVLQKKFRTSLELSRLHRRFETDPSPTTLLQLVEFLERDIWFLSVNRYHWSIICKIAYTCYREHLDDPDKISRLMLCLAKVYHEGRFVNYFREAMVRIIAASKEGVWKYIGFPNMNFLEYWLHWANRCRLKIRGVRLISSMFLSKEFFLRHLPCASYTTVFTLVKYGARVADTRKIHKDFVPEVLVSTLSCMLKLGIRKGYWTEDLEVKVDLRHVITEVTIQIHNFFMLLDETENPHTTALYLADRYDPIWKYHIPSIEKLLPFYEKTYSGCFYGHMKPPSLRHLCRHTIRRVLHTCWQLPDGVCKLPIFPVLHDYINLLTR